MRREEVDERYIKWTEQANGENKIGSWKKVKKRQRM